MTILDPRAELTPAHISGATIAGSIQGRRVGLRRDNFWESWDRVTDVWADALRRDGAEPVIWRAPVGKGKEAAKGTEDFAEFLSSIDMAIVGLCNCGSCTMWAIHDTIGALNADLPTLTVATEHFVPLAKALAERAGRTDLRLLVLPYPLEGRPRADVEKVAANAYEDMLAAMGVTR